MISSEVQRTLVKSPPELWAELSDPAALARHLGELGEIRIVRTEPERTVEWAAENTTGTVSIKPSGWGTKVTLSVTREVPEQASATEPSPEAEYAPAATPDVEAIDAPEPIAAAHAPEPEPTAFETDEPEPEATTVPETESEPEPRRGFFARLFGRRRKTEPRASYEQKTAVEAHDAFAAVRQVLAPETFAAEHPFVAAPEVRELDPEPAATAPESTMSEPDTDPEQADDISAELLAAEEAGVEEVTAVLTAVLDRLGAAHHRPFSRS